MHILFVPGLFGTTLQYLLRTFGSTYASSQLVRYPNLSHGDIITADGSMHTFYKTGHYCTKDELTSLINGTIAKPDITTPTYPMVDYHADEVINFFKNNFPTDKCVLMYADSVEYAEINMLAQYYKCAIGVINQTIGIFCGDNFHNIVNWNSNYTHWTDMQQWELREWLSIFYPTWIAEWIDANSYADPNWLTVSSKELLDNTQETFQNILEYSGGINQMLISDLHEFTTYWRSKQQYLLDEYSLIKKIVQTTIANEPFRWEELNVIAESIIQQHLRLNGYEIKCYNLNVFPTSSTELHNLLEKL